MPYSPLKEKALGVLRLLVISENDVRFRGEALIHNQIKAAVHEHPSSVSVFRAFPQPRCRIKFALFRQRALPLSNSMTKICQITHYYENVFGGALGNNSRELSGCFLGAPWVLLEAPWELLGVSVGNMHIGWEILEAPWKLLGAPREVLGSPWELLGAP